MYYNDMSLGYIDDVSVDFADYLISNRLSLTEENKASVLEGYNDYVFRKSYTEDFKKVEDYFSPHLAELKTVIKKVLNEKNTGDKYRHRSIDGCTFIYNDDLSSGLRVKLWGGGYTYTDEAFNVYINSKIPLENAKIELSRKSETDDCRYSWSLSIDKGDAVYWTGIEDKLKGLYKDLENDKSKK